MNAELKTAVAGAGISGLSTAYFLKTRLEKNGTPADLRLFEAAERAGGIISGEKKDGFLLEYGPDTFISEKPWALELARELGLEDQLIGVREGFQRSFLVSGGKLHAIPKGFYLLAAPRLRTLWQLPFLSLKAKCRMAADLWISPRKSSDDESVAAFIRRRFGEEALWKIGQPMIGGIYTADPEKLSLEATFPRFRRMEEQYGSVIRGLRAREAGRGPAEKEASGPRYRLFLSFRNGMPVLTEALRQQLGDTMQTGRKISRLSQRQKLWRLEFEDGQVHLADAVCLALPAAETARLLKEAVPDAARELEAIRSESAATINLAWLEKDLPPLPNGAGFVIPQREGYPLVGVTFAHQKFSERAPSGGILIRAFAGGAYHRGITGQSDEILVNQTLETLHKILGWKAPPRWTRVSRFLNAMPQFEVGHLQRICRFREAVSRMPGLFVTGNFLSGVGIPDCVHEARGAADNILNFLTHSSTQSISR